jgi:3-methyladenine DNA glycosylase/8-oxoguanine DNA glycosylase
VRPSDTSLHDVPRRDALAGLHAVATASLTPRGVGYDPRLRLRRRIVALRGGENAIVVALGWVRGVVRVDVLACGSCSSDDAEHAIDTARALVAVDDDPTEFLTMVRSHPVLGPLSREADPRLGSTPTVFESFAVAVIEQLVTGFEARASIRRLWSIAGERIPGGALVATPTAAAVRRVPMWKLHAIGVGTRRAATLREGAIRGDAIERLRGLPGDVVVTKLQSLPGVGPWTANAVARAGLGWSDAVPVGDFHAPFAISAALGGPHGLSLDDRPAADAAMLQVLEPFRPHRARVALLLERHATRTRKRPLPRVDPHRREPWRY